ncbi:mannosyltransferase OCH1-like enzyme [Stenotrophomonas sp. 2619]|uniref:glycosyltransferase family 32 protein n=1 Tax=Stenotrophomonas sp. 2619 TaxID=3156316 RepID=UPI003399DC2E
MIPKTIHYCWFGGNALPALYSRCIDTWAEKLPDYRIVRWDESSARFDTPFLQYCLKKKQWAFLSDYIRLRAIADEGGIYLDADIEVVKSFDPLLAHDCFLGLEAPGRPTTGVIGSVPGHWLPRECMRVIDERFAARKPYLIAPEVAMASVAAGDPSTVAILSEEHFYPYNPYDDSRPVRELMFSSITENTYAIHHWGKSWRQSFVSRALKKLGF